MRLCVGHDASAFYLLLLFIKWGTKEIQPWFSWTHWAHSIEIYKMEKTQIFLNDFTFWSQCVDCICIWDFSDINCVWRIPLNLLSAPESAHWWEFRFEFVAVDFSYLSIIHSERIFSRVCSFLLCFTISYFCFFFLVSMNDISRLFVGDRVNHTIKWPQSQCTKWKKSFLLFLAEHFHTRITLCPNSKRNFGSTHTCKKNWEYSVLVWLTPTRIFN